MDAKVLTPEGFVENRRERRERSRAKGRIRQKPPPWAAGEWKGMNLFPMSRPVDRRL